MKKTKLPNPQIKRNKKKTIFNLQNESDVYKFRHSKTERKKKKKEKRGCLGDGAGARLGR